MCEDNREWEPQLNRSNRDGSTGTDGQVRATWTPPEQPHEAIIEAIADASGRDPIALDPLYDSIAVDALDAVLTGARAPDRSDVRVSFCHDGLAITIDGNGTVTVTEAGEDRG